MTRNTDDTTASSSAERPNVVVILADDMGYGDPSHLNPSSKVPTPRVDALAAAGRTCTDAHSGSAVCTPTRYGLLTGRHCFRTRLTEGVLNAYDPPLIDADRPTLASLLGDAGYHTACIGKWHLGVEWTYEDGRTTREDPVRSEDATYDIDFTTPVAGGPTDRGFDEAFYLAGSANMNPFVFIEGDRPATEPTASLPEGWFGNPGPMAPDWNHEEILPRITDRAVAYIEDRGQPEPGAEDGDGEPFFLYLPLNAPHTPIAPDHDAHGRSDAGPYGDFVWQIDRSVGAVCDALERTGVAEDTLVIVTSDNGSPAHAHTYDGETRPGSVTTEYGHDPNAPWRGLKADAYEAGHRVPFVVRWPGEIPAGTVCDATLSLNDLVATLAPIAGYDAPDGAIDSRDVSRALVTDADNGGRDSIVHHAYDGTLAIRSGAWKLIDSAGTGGGFSAPRDSGPEEGDRQLYRLDTDPGETLNRESLRPEVADRLEDALGCIRAGDADHGAPVHMDER